jgi:hypothetical protein
MMTKQAVVVAVEGLGTQLLSPYGNSWSGTNALSRIASRGLVASNYWHNDFSNEMFYRRILSSSRRIPAQQPSDEIQASLLECSPSLQTQWLTDIALDLPASPKLIPWHQSLPKPNRGDEILDSSIGQIFEHVLQWFSSASSECDQLLWLHSGGLQHRWDAPNELRHSYCQEDDPEPPEGDQPPEFSVDEDTDPDLITGWTQAAAAQVFLLDQCLSAVEIAISERGWEETCLLMIVGLGGYSFGEHGYVGFQKKSLWSETVQSPCIIRPGNQLPVTLYRPEIYQNEDLSRVLRDWFANPTTVSSGLLNFSGPQAASKWKPEHQIAICENDQELLVATPHWEFRRVTPDSAWEIFIKPDDRWDVNDIASRVPEISEAWTNYWQEIEPLRKSSDRSSWPTLPKELTERSY